MPENYPFWASWASKDIYLPPKYHSSESFQQVLLILKKVLGDLSVLNGGKLMLHCFFWGWHTGKFAGQWKWSLGLRQWPQTIWSICPLVSEK